MKYELHHGDCLEVMAGMEAGSVDAVVCDPPYGTTACAWDSIIPLEPMWEQLKRICKPNGAIVLTASQPFASVLVMSSKKLFKYDWIWVKNRPTGAQHSKNKPMNKHEHILVFSLAPINHLSLIGEKRMNYYPVGVSTGKIKTIKDKGTFSNTIGYRKKQIGINYISHTGFPNTVLEYKKEESHIHPTQKPVALMEYLIRTYTNESETVLDFTMGSGSTGVAAMLAGRRFIGIEKDAEYFEIAKARISTTGKPKPKTTAIQGRRAVQVPLCNLG